MPEPLGVQWGRLAGREGEEAAAGGGASALLRLPDRSVTLVSQGSRDSGMAAPGLSNQYRVEPAGLVLWLLTICHSKLFDYGIADLET